MEQTKKARLRLKVGLTVVFHCLFLFLSLLQLLGCPFLEGLEDGVIDELLVVSKGDARLRILKWLLGKLVYDVFLFPPFYFLFQGTSLV